jgi:hypothetical protein
MKHMKLTLIANIEDHGEAGFIAWIENIKGLVVQAATMEEAHKELLTSIKVKLAFDWGIPYADLKEVTDENEMKRLQREHEFKKSSVALKQEINLMSCPAA